MHQQREKLEQRHRGVAFSDMLRRLQKLAKEWSDFLEELRKDKINKLVKK